MTGAVSIMLGSGAVVISVSPENADGTSGSNVVTSNSVTATVSGGVITSGSWIRLSGSTAIEPTSPDSPTTEFTAIITLTGIRSAIFAFEAVVNGVTYQSAAVPVVLERT